MWAIISGSSLTSIFSSFLSLQRGKTHHNIVLFILKSTENLMLDLPKHHDRNISYVSEWVGFGFFCFLACMRKESRRENNFKCVASLPWNCLLVAVVTTEQQGVIYHPFCKKYSQQAWQRNGASKSWGKIKERVKDNIMSFRTLGKQKLLNPLV